MPWLFSCFYKWDWVMNSSAYVSVWITFSSLVWWEMCWSQDSEGKDRLPNFTGLIVGGTAIGPWATTELCGKSFSKKPEGETCRIQNFIIVLFKKQTSSWAWSAGGITCLSHMLGGVVWQLPFYLIWYPPPPNPAAPRSLWKGGIGLGLAPYQEK